MAIKSRDDAMGCNPDKVYQTVYQLVPVENNISVSSNKSFILSK